MKKIGTVTIGQAPRIDVIPGIVPILGSDVEIVESGALDGLSLSEIRQFSPQQGDYGSTDLFNDEHPLQAMGFFVGKEIYYIGVATPRPPIENKSVLL